MPSPSWRRTKNLINFLTPLSVQLSLEQGFSREKGNEILGRAEQRFNNDAFNQIRRKIKWKMEGNRCLECVESIRDVEFVAKIGKFSTYLHNDGTKYRGAALTYESALFAVRAKETVAFPCCLKIHSIPVE